MKIEGICHQHSHARGNLKGYSPGQVKLSQIEDQRCRKELKSSRIINMRVNANAY